MDPKMIKVILNWERSANMIEIQSFLSIVGEIQSFFSLIGCYKRFFKCFSTIALPLDKLTCKVCLVEGM